MFRLADVLELAGASLAGSPASPDLPLAGAETDSRRVRPGQLFVAYRGDRFDGHDYARQAADSGAAALLVQRPLPIDLPQVLVADPRAALAALAGRALERARLEHVVGITGSAGKTTTRLLLAGLLEAAFPGAVLSSTGSYNTDTGLAMNILGGLRPGLRCAVFELGCQRFGEIAALCRIVRPNAAIVTSIGSAHLAFLGDVEGVARAKGELVEAVPPAGLVALNGDDPRALALRGRTRAEVVTFGLTPSSDCSVELVRDDGVEGSEIRWRFLGCRGRARLRLPGAHNARNAAAAIAVALRVGASPEAIDVALPSMQPPPGRLTPRPGPAGSRLLDDSYNASREAVESALRVLATWHGRRVALLGDMFELGAASPAEHARLGGALVASTDVLAVVGRDAQLAADAAIEEGLDPRRVARFPCDPGNAESLAAAREAAARWLRDTLRQGDLALVKASRGMGLDAVVGALEEQA